MNLIFDVNASSRLVRLSFTRFFFISDFILLDIPIIDGIAVIEMHFSIPETTIQVIVSNMLLIIKI